jgi:hypothetical protein
VNKALVFAFFFAGRRRRRRTSRTPCFFHQLSNLAIMATLELIKEAVLALKDRTGSSIPAIKKWIETEKKVSRIGWDPRGGGEGMASDWFGRLKVFCSFSYKIRPVTRWAAGGGGTPMMGSASPLLPRRRRPGGGGLSQPPQRLPGNLWADRYSGTKFYANFSRTP